MIHRIIQIKSVSADSAVVQTKGDANAAPDPFTVRVKGPWIYQVKTAVPFVGYAALAVHSPRGRRILLVIAAALFALAWIRVARQRRRSLDTDAMAAADLDVTQVTAKPQQLVQLP